MQLIPHIMKGIYDQDDSVMCWGNLSKVRVRWGEKSTGKSNYIGMKLRLKVATLKVVTFLMLSYCFPF